MSGVFLQLLGALSFLRKPGVWIGVGVVLALAAGASAAVFIVSPPPLFPVQQMVQVEEGLPLSIVADHLAEQHVIQSPFVFTVMLRVLGKDNDIDSGIYIFEKPENLFVVAARIVKGEFGFVEKRVTVTEGMAVWEIAEEIQAAIPDFDAEEFIAEASPVEGYLFPDTYFFMPDVTPGVVVNRMLDNFDAKVRPLYDQFDASDLSFAEVITLASILEKEARTYEVRQQIAGILMNRLEDDMPLQVDAVFGYIHQKETYSPTLDDLESDSPYNTYRNRGLPPGPINNPGIEAIEAALNPISSDYIYYLTDNEGVMHYARTFEEHKANRERYGI